MSFQLPIALRSQWGDWSQTFSGWQGSYMVTPTFASRYLIHATSVSV